MVVLLGEGFPVSTPVRLVSRSCWLVFDSSVAVWVRCGVLPLHPFPSRRPPAVTRRSRPSLLSFMQQVSRVWSVSVRCERVKKKSLESVGGVWKKNILDVSESGHICPVTWHFDIQHPRFAQSLCCSIDRCYWVPQLQSNLWGEYPLEIRWNPLTFGHPAVFPLEAVGVLFFSKLLTCSRHD